MQEDTTSDEALSSDTDAGEGADSGEEADNEDAADEDTGSGDTISEDTTAEDASGEEVTASVTSADGSTTINYITVEWLTEDDDDDDDCLTISPDSTDNSSQVVKIRLSLSLTGTDDYEAGSIQITIPKTIFEDRYGDAAGTMVLSVPEDPETGATFSYTETENAYILINTKTLSASSSLMFEFSIEDLIPNELVGDGESDDCYESDDFYATVSVVTSSGEELTLTSNSIYAVIDTNEEIGTAYDRYETLYTSWPSSWDETLMPEEDDDYIYVVYYSWVSVTGNQSYSMSLTSSVIVTDSDGNAIEGAVVLGMKYSGTVTTNDSDSSSMTLTLTEDGYRTSGSTGYYVYTYVAIPKSSVSENGTYSITHTASYSLTSLDDEKTTTASRSATATYVVSDTPTTSLGSFSVDKSGRYTYGSALSTLRNGLDTSVTYSVRTIALRDTETEGDSTTETEDSTLWFSGEDALSGEDYDFVSLQIGKPTMYTWSYLKSTTYTYNSSGTYTQISGGSYGYISDSSADIPDIYVYGKGKDDTSWTLYAVVSYASGSASFTTYSNATSSGTRVFFPDGVDAVKTTVTNSADGIIYTVYPTITLSGESKTISDLVEELYEDTDTPSTTLYNKASMTTTDSSGTQVGTFSDVDYDTLSGSATTVTMKKSLDYEDDTSTSSVTLHYSATVYEVSNLTTLTNYQTAVEDGGILEETGGVFYDLLPVGVVPDTSTVTMNGTGDTVQSVELIEDYQGSGRTLMIVTVSLTPTVTYLSKSTSGSSYDGYGDTFTLSFDAVYSWESLADYGATLNNVIAFESNNTSLGTVSGYEGEPDDPTYGNHNSSAAAVSGVEDLMTDLDADRDDPVFVYAHVSENLSVNTTTVTSLTKKVTANGSGTYGTGTDEDDTVVNVYDGGSYSYRLSVTGDSQTYQKALVFYDLLDGYTLESTDKYCGDITWQGTFLSVDTDVLTAAGIAPVIYYSTVPSLVLDSLEGDLDLTDTSIWSTTAPSDLSAVTAIAVDCSLSTDGEEYVLEPGETLSILINMKAVTAAELAETYSDYTASQFYDTNMTDDESEAGITGGAHAYNSASMTSQTSQNGTIWTDTAIVDTTYTKVGLAPFTITVTKSFDDENNQDGIRPKSVSITLLADGEAAETATLSDENEWSCTFSSEDGLSVLSDNGTTINYTISEETDGYSLNSTLSKTDKGYTFTLVNVHVPETTTISGTKTWDDDSDAAGARPESVKISLYADGVLQSTKTVSASSDGTWTYSFTNLPVYSGGEEITYTVEESVYCEGYAAATDGYNVVNTYDPYGNLSITKVIEDVTDASKDAEFTFELTLKDENGDPVSGEYTYIITDAEGNTESTGTIGNGDTITLTGGQTITIYEIPSETTYEIKETDIPDGFKLTDRDGDEGSIQAGRTVSATFTNTYSAAADLYLTATKTLTGQTLTARAFRFQVLDANKTAIRGAYNASDGTVSFSKISYDLDDVGQTYTYYIVEVDQNETYYTYDETVYTVTVEVSDAGDGTLSLDVTYSNKDGNTVDAVTFSNSYTASGTLSLTAWKTLDGRDLEDEEFSFVLKDMTEDSDTYGTQVATGTNDADGVISFSALSFTQDDVGKTYIYVASEAEGSDDTVVYTTQTFTYTVTVTDNGDGTLGFTYTVDENPVFENTLEDGTLTIQKTVSTEDDYNAMQTYTFVVQIVGTDLDESIEFERVQLASAVAASSSTEDENADASNGSTNDADDTDSTDSTNTQSTAAGLTYDENDAEASAVAASLLSGEKFSLTSLSTAASAAQTESGDTDEAESEDASEASAADTATGEEQGDASASGDDVDGATNSTSDADSDSGVSDDDGSDNTGVSAENGTDNGGDRESTTDNGDKSDDEEGDNEGEGDSDSSAGNDDEDNISDSSNAAGDTVNDISDTSGKDSEDSSDDPDDSDAAADEGSSDTDETDESADDAAGTSESDDTSANDNANEPAAATADGADASGTSDASGDSTTDTTTDGSSDETLETDTITDEAAAEETTTYETGSRDDPIYTEYLNYLVDPENGDYTVNEEAEGLIGYSYDTYLGYVVTEDGYLYVFPKNGKSGTLLSYFKDLNVYKNYSGYIKVIVFAEGVKLGVSSYQASGAFGGLGNVESFYVAYLDVSDCTSMYGCFYADGSLEAVYGLGYWDVSKVGTFRQMFLSCTSLKILDGIGEWKFGSKTPNVTNMFISCSALEELDLSGWEIEIGNCDFSAASNWGGVFNSCSSLKKVVLGEGWGDWGTSDLQALPGANGGKSGYVESDDGSVTYYTGYWICYDSVAEATAYSRKNLMINWATDGSMAGTWVWETLDTLYIYYEANVDEDESYAGSMSRDTLDCTDSSASYTVLDNAYYRFGYTFTGWNTAADGSGTDVEVGTELDPSTVFTTYGNSSTLKLYAQWEKLDTTTTVTENTFKITLYAGEAAEISLPAGTGYLVYEETPSGWVLVSSSGTSGTIEANETSTASFVNAQTDQATTTAYLSATKTLDGEAASSGAFSFTLEATTDGAPMPSGAGEGSSYTISNGAGGIADFGSITYTEAGTYQYIITENDASESNDDITYDNSVYFVKVTVAEDEDGALSSETTYQKISGTVVDTLLALGVTKSNMWSLLSSLSGVETVTSVSFANTTDPGTLKITKALDTSSGKTLTDQTFTVLVSFDSGASTQTVTLDSSNNWTYTIENLTAGTKYTVTETSIPSGYSLVSYQTSDYPSTGITETVTSSSVSGTIQSNVTDIVTVTNTYAASGSFNVTATKTLTGRSLTSGEFTFMLKDADGNTVDTTTNDSAGQIAFDTVTLTAAGTYTYTISEVVPSGTDSSYDEAMNYDTHSCTVTVVATDTGSGTLTCTVTYSTDSSGESENVFTNTVKTGSLSISKTVTGAQSGSSGASFAFTVTLRDSDGETLTGSYAYEIQDSQGTAVTGGTGTITSGGTVSLSGGQTVTISGLPAGSTYSVSEASSDGYTSSATGASGTITADTTVTASFNNTYSASGTWTPAASKILTGGTDLVQGAFSFIVTDRSGSVVSTGSNASASCDESDNQAQASVTFTSVEYTQEGTYTYTMSEVSGADSGYSYDGTAWTVTVTVTDNGNGTLSTSAAYASSTVTSATSAVFTNGVTVSWTPSATKTLTGRTQSAGEFSFALIETDSSWQVLAEDGETSKDTSESDTDDTSGSSTDDTSDSGTDGTSDGDTGDTSGSGTDDTSDSDTDDTSDDDADSTYSATGSNTSTVKSGTASDVGFTAVTFAKAGTYYYLLCEVIPDGATNSEVNDGQTAYADASDTEKLTAGWTYQGVTYDVTQVKVTVTVTANSKGKLSVSASYSQTASFANTYEAAPAEDQVEASKDVSGADVAVYGGAFTFVLTDSTGTEIGTATNAQDGQIFFKSITFSEPGEYVYYLTESYTGTTPAGISVSATVYTIVYTVWDDGLGQLQYTQSVTARTGDTTTSVSSINFLNVYDPDAVSASLTGIKLIESTDAGASRSVEEGEFTFVITETDSSWEELEDGICVTADTAQYGAFSFSEYVTFTMPGTRYFTITEQAGSDSTIGYSEEVYYVTVTATGTEVLSLSTTITDADGASVSGITFTNTYTPTPVTDTVTGTKTLSGRALSGSEFTFTASDADGTVVAKTTNDTDGSIALEIEFTQSGVYYYTISEVNNGAGGVTYDTTVYTLVAVVEVDEETHALEVTSSQLIASGESVEEVSFANTYTASPVTVTPVAEKTLTGADLADGQFSFALYDADGTLLETVTNSADGTILFSTLTFDEEGTYTYTVREIDDGQADITYDETIHTLVVTVTDGGEGVLTASAVWDGDESVTSPVFANSYVPEEDEDTPSDGTNEDESDTPSDEDDGTDGNEGDTPSNEDNGADEDESDTPADEDDGTDEDESDTPSDEDDGTGEDESDTPADEDDGDTPEDAGDAGTGDTDMRLWVLLLCAALIAAAYLKHRIGRAEGHDSDR